MRNTLILLALLITGSCTVPAQFATQQRAKKTTYEEITFEDLTKRYLSKSHANNTIEGVYSVSSVITKKGPQLISGEVRERVVDRKENYARVAILKDRPGSSREYIEVSLTYREANTYPVVGEFNVFGEGRGLIYKHFEPDGSTMSFTMMHDSDLIEGEYSKVEGRQTITYRLSYLKIYPN